MIIKREKFNPKKYNPILQPVSKKEAEKVNSYIDKVLKEYGKTIKLLGRISK